MLLVFPLSSCEKKDKGSGANHLYDVPLSGNPKSLDPQFANDPSSNTVIKNLYSGLVSSDINGNIVCCNAESYTVSSDQLTYTFTLRQDNYWFYDQNDNDEIDENEYFPVTAHDYVFALQRVLDPRMQSPYASNFSCIKNGSSVINGKTAPETAAIFAPDDFTLEITLEYPSAEFLGMLSTAAAYPCNREFFDSTKGRYGLDDNSVMSNGPFYVRQWFFDPYGKHNILYMRRNEINVNEKFQVLPSYVSFTIQNSDSDVPSASNISSSVAIDGEVRLRSSCDRKPFVSSERDASSSKVKFFCIRNCFTLCPISIRTTLPFTNP